MKTDKVDSKTVWKLETKSKTALKLHETKSKNNSKNLKTKWKQFRNWNQMKTASATFRESDSAHSPSEKTGTGGRESWNLRREKRRATTQLAVVVVYEYEQMKKSLWTPRSGVQAPHHGFWGGAPKTLPDSDESCCSSRVMNCRSTLSMPLLLS